VLIWRKRFCWCQSGKLCLQQKERAKVRTKPIANGIVWRSRPETSCWKDEWYLKRIKQHHPWNRTQSPDHVRKQSIRERKEKDALHGNPWSSHFDLPPKPVWKVWNPKKTLEERISSLCANEVLICIGVTTPVLEAKPEDQGELARFRCGCWVSESVSVWVGIEMLSTGTNNRRIGNVCSRLSCKREVGSVSVLPDGKET